MNDLFKAAGIHVGETKLIEQVVNPIKILKGAANVSNISRAGMKPSARENLFANWDIRETDIEKAYGDENLKNTHGEMYHTDNDKKVKKEVTTVVEVDVHSDGQEKLPANKAATSLTLSQCLDDLVKTDNSIVGTNISIDGPTGNILINTPNSNIFLKKADDDSSSTGEEEDAQQKEIDREVQNEKNRKPEIIGRELKMSELDEIYNLVKAKTGQTKVHQVMSEYKEGTLHSGSKKGPKVATRKQAVAIAMEQAGLSNKSGSADYESAMEISDEEMARRIKRGVHENSKGVSRKSDSLDDLVDLVKDYKVKKANDPKPPVVKTGIINKTANPFVKAAGKGGVLFDFGNITGNPVADNYNSILKDNTDPTQESIREGQIEEYDQALREYVSKGNEKYSQDHNIVEPDGVNVAESGAGSSGLIDKAETIDYREQFHGTALNIGGENVKAQSETDAYVLKQHEHLFKSDMNIVGNDQIIDASSGGSSVVLDATNGKAYDIITGEEVKPK